jgi:hypothetical protein
LSRGKDLQIAGVQREYVDQFSLTGVAVEKPFSGDFDSEICS